MTDIVERLRHLQKQGTNNGRVTYVAKCAADAIAEIEQLREQLRAVLLHVADLRAEIKQLRANEAAALFSFRETNNMALEEIKQLREALRNRGGNHDQ